MKRALAVFAKAPIAGQVKTRLMEGTGDALTAEQAARLYRCFVLDTLERAQRVPDCDVVLFYAPVDAREPMQGLVHTLPGEGGIELAAQRAGDLGARMHGGFETLFVRGAEAVVLIGADLPTLPVSRLTDAFAALERKPVVLGPSTDGGYHLVGLREPRPELFEEIEWGTSRVLAQTVERIERLGLEGECLEPWYDVDTLADLDWLVAHLQLLNACRETDLPGHTVEGLRELGKL